MYEPFYDLDKEPARRLAAFICDQKANDAMTTKERVELVPPPSLRGKRTTGLMLCVLILASFGVPFLLWWFFGLPITLTFLLIELIVFLVILWLTGRSDE